MKTQKHEVQTDTLPDSWDRFERAVDAAVRTGPKHKPVSKPKECPASKGRVHKGKTGD